MLIHTSSSRAKRRHFASPLPLTLLLDPYCESVMYCYRPDSITRFAGAGITGNMQLEPHSSPITVTPDFPHLFPRGHLKLRVFISSSSSSDAQRCNRNSPCALSLAGKDNTISKQQFEGAHNKELALQPLGYDISFGRTDSTRLLEAPINVFAPLILFF